jgi:hypothetical protein
MAGDIRPDAEIVPDPDEPIKQFRCQGPGRNINDERRVKCGRIRTQSVIDIPIDAVP